MLVLPDLEDVLELRRVGREQGDVQHALGDRLLCRIAIRVKGFALERKNYRICKTLSKYVNEGYNLSYVFLVYRWFLAGEYHLPAVFFSLQGHCDYSYYTNVLRNPRTFDNVTFNHSTDSTLKFRYHQSSL